MVVSVCPAAIVAAPVEDVWELLTQTSKYDSWWDAHLERSEPEGPATPGQMVYATTNAFGKRWDVSFVIRSVDPAKHKIQFDVTLPLGIVDHATFVCTPVDAESCHVQFG
jgi:uncharacterized protein YndB with AHSA1/START domain